MEGNYLTAGELALIDQRRGYGYGYDGGCGYGHKGMSRGAATGIGLAAGLGGAALLGVLVVGWGVNQASKARTQGAMKSIDLLAAQAVRESQSREAWQNTHAPTLTQYVDVQTGAGAFSGATSNANALAAALAYNQNAGINSAIGGCNFLRVARYSAPQPCPCDSE